MDREKVIALFDFDGTITKGDTFIPFLLFKSELVEFFMKIILLSTAIVAFFFRRLSNEELKERFVQQFIAGCSKKNIDTLAEKFIDKKINRMCRKKALTQLNLHKARNHKIVIVSASPSYLIEKWANKMSFDSISTELEIIDHIYTGKLKSKNCYGEEKVNRILGKYDLSDYSEIYAYGDTKGDIPMLKLATKSYYKPFR